MSKDLDRFLYTAIYKGEIKLVENFEQTKVATGLDVNATVASMFKKGDFARKLASKSPNTQTVIKIAQPEGLCLLFCAVYDVGDHAERLVVVTLSVYPSGSNQATAGRVLESETRVSFQFLDDVRTRFGAASAGIYCDYNMFCRTVHERIVFYSGELDDSNSATRFTAPTTHETTLDVSEKFERTPLLADVKWSTSGRTSPTPLMVEEGSGDLEDYTSVAKKARIKNQGKRNYRMVILVGAFIGIIILGWVGFTIVGVLPPVWKW